MRKTFKQCNRCHKGGLHWEKVSGRWRLYDSKGNEHACNPGAVIAQQNAASANSIGDPELNEDLEPMADGHTAPPVEVAASYASEYEQWANEEAYCGR